MFLAWIPRGSRGCGGRGAIASAPTKSARGGGRRAVADRIRARFLSVRERETDNWLTQALDANRERPAWAARRATRRSRAMHPRATRHRAGASLPSPCGPLRGVSGRATSPWAPSCRPDDRRLSSRAASTVQDMRLVPTPCRSIFSRATRCGGAHWWPPASSPVLFGVQHLAGGPRSRIGSCRSRNAIAWTRCLRKRHAKGAARGSTRPTASSANWFTCGIRKATSRWRTSSRCASSPCSKSSVAGGSPRSSTTGHRSSSAPPGSCLT